MRTWTESDLALLAGLKEKEALLPGDAPRALLSVRLSVLTDETTSPVRQELDLRVLALERGCRVVGVAADLNVSATKVAPWKRKSLGDWLNNRTPEFEVILFWKLDRFIRNVMDLHLMLNWCQKYEKNLISKHDTIDITSVTGKLVAIIIGGVAEIEAANTSTRVASLWDYNKTQSEWLVGKPPYGYAVVRGEDGRNSLAVVENEHTALHWARRMIMRGRSGAFVVRCLKRSKLMSDGLTVGTLHRRLRNPGVLGYRVEEDKQGGARSSKLVIGHNGEAIRVAEGIFTQAEFDDLQVVLDEKSKNQPSRRPGGVTKFLGVLICADCRTNMIVQATRNNFGTYAYLRCQKCKSGGRGAPNPQVVYERLVEDVLAVLGDLPVQVREYAKGLETRAEVKRQDCWVSVYSGKSFREHWEEGGMEAMAADLLRAGIKCEVTRARVPGIRAPRIHLKLLIPKDVRERLVLRHDDFTGIQSVPAFL